MTWIIPKQLHTSAFVPDTEALISDSSELSQICGQSLTLRSKHSLSRTWLQKWKRDSWTQHLSGRILRPSLGKHFEIAWTSSLVATPANHSAQPANVEAKTIQGISGPISQTVFDFSSLSSASLKTSKDISRWGCPTSSKTWQEWVIERRGAYLARLNAVRLTRGSECLSWPTVQTSEAKSDTLSDRAAKGKQVMLCHAVRQWPTVQVTDSMSPCLTEKRLTRPKGTQLRESVHGPAVPASSSTDGSRRGLSWPTPQTMDVLPVRPVDAFAESNRTRGGRKNRQALSNLREAIHSPVYQVKQWQTATVSTGAHRQKDGSMIDKLDQQVKQWPTPEASQGGRQGGSFSQNSWKKEDGTPKQPSLAQATIMDQQVKNWSNGKLNPRWVETLMGLPVGWTMPSCASPVTIAPTSCDCSGTESSQQQPQ